MIVWRGLDPPGHEACRIVGQTLEGTAVLAEPVSALTYRVVCDEAWRTRSVSVSGWIESRSVDMHITIFGGRWTLNGDPQRAVDGCLDVDLNFSPSTNTLPIRRLGLAIGASATIAVAWLRFPSLTLERLEQTYRRTAERTWQYSSEDFTAEVEVDEEGLVTRYEGLWIRE
jgi:uncharacterized protein